MIQKSNKWKEYYQANKEKERQRKREYYKSNKEKYKARAEKYKAKNLEKIRLYEQEYRNKNKEKEKVRSSEWYFNQDPKLLYAKRKRRQLELGHYSWYITPERCYKLYSTNAKKKNIAFEISLEEFKSFWQTNCFYCGTNILTIGIDRIDNTKGYSILNIISCCKTCNFMKGSSSQQNFVEQCLLIAKKYKETSHADQPQSDQSGS